MKLSCSAGFVRAVYSRLAVLSPSKQELGGAAQQLALHLGLHISPRLLCWEFVSCRLVLVWRGMDVEKWISILDFPSPIPFLKHRSSFIFGSSLATELHCSSSSARLWVQTSCYTRNFVTKPIYVTGCKMDSVDLQAERRWAWRHSQAWCCSSCLTAPLEDRAELELLELSLSLPSLMSYFCSELAVLWQSSGQHSSLANCILYVGNGNHIWKEAQELWSGCSWHRLPQNEKGTLFTEIIQMGYLCTLGKKPYLFSAVIATLKSLTDKGFQRLRMLHLWVVVLLLSPQEDAVWEMLSAVDIDTSSNSQSMCESQYPGELTSLISVY